VESARETKHGHRAKRRGLGRLRFFLRFQPLEQAARVLIVHLPDFFNRQFNSAHTKYNSEKRAFMQHIAADNEWFGLNRI
jgi:hypothetical protein